MPKFRKKPVVIDAVQLVNSHESIREVVNFLDGNCPDVPKPMTDEQFEVYADEVVRPLRGIKFKQAKANKPFNDWFASFNDWIIGIDH